MNPTAQTTAPTSRIYVDSSIMDPSNNDHNLEVEAGKKENFKTQKDNLHNVQHLPYYKQSRINIVQ